MTADPRWRVLITLVVVLPLLLAVSIHFNDLYADTMLPLYRAVLGSALSGFDVVQISLDKVNGESVVAATVLAVSDQTVGGRTAQAGFSISASTLAAHAGKHVVLSLLVPMLWPGLKIAQRLKACVVALLLLPLIEVIDIPLVLAGAVRDLLEANLAPEIASQSWLVAWVQVLDGGGRVVVPFALGMASVQFAQMRCTFLASRKCVT
jgi:hypothetical protein